ncbi:MAG: cell division ATP-binding protein FtsE [Hyphomicrobiales bacterium]
MEKECIFEAKGIDIYQSKKLILSDVTVDIKKGEFVYLIGKTGSGKSSLLKVIYAELPVDKGIARVGEYDLINLKTRKVPYLRRKLGIVFQDFQLLQDRSIRENLMFVLRATDWKSKEDATKRIIEVLNQVDLMDHQHKLPHQLSGGEQQRVAIARALLNNPELILADEPTGNLDPETANEIMKLLMKISESGCAVLMATHNYNLIMKFPARVINCENGKVLVSGNQTN